MGRSLVIKKMLAALICVSFLVSGCGISGEIYEKTPHISEPQGQIPSDMTIVTTYAAIKNQLKEMVSSAIPSAKLAVMDYWGDIDSDLKNIIGEITTIDPIGTFAVSSIVYEQAKAAAYHQVSISIQYKRTEEEIKSIKDVPNDRALREEIAEMVGNFNTYSL